MKTKTKLEIINETVAYYSEDPRRRAFSGMSCRYITRDGKMCAFGRCEVDPNINEEADVRGRFRDRFELMDVALKIEYRGHQISFWEDIQRLHDNKSHWNESGLSDSGMIHVQILKEKYS